MKNVKGSPGMTDVLLPRRVPAEGLGIHFLGILLILSFFLLPMYIFPSGQLQLVDLPLFLTIIVIFFLKGKIEKEITSQIMSLFPFVIWTFLVNGTYYIMYSKYFWYIMSSGAILYGFLLMYAFTFLFKRLVDGNRIIYINVALAFSILGCFLLRGYDEEGRAALSFNNANQLAYFAIILCSYAILLMQYEIMVDIKKFNNDLFNMIFLLFSHFFVLISLSRAGIFAFAALDACLVKNTRRVRILLPAALAFLIAISYVFYFHPDYIQERLAVREKRQWTMDSLIFGRDGVIGRVLAPLEKVSGLEILFGHGAVPQRLEERTSPLGHRQRVMEVHNSFGDVLKSYGIVGLLLFCYWVVKIVWSSKNFTNGLWVMAALFVFHFGHLGIRFRSFWIFMAFFLVMATIREKPENQNIGNKTITGRF